VEGGEIERSDLVSVIKDSCLRKGVMKLRGFWVDAHHFGKFMLSMWVMDYNLRITSYSSLAQVRMLSRDLIGQLKLNGPF
jgi:hypothetical protein